MNNHINSEIIEIHEDIRPSQESTPPPRYQNSRESRESRLLSQINSQSREITRLKKQLDKYEKKAVRYKRKYIKNKHYLYLERSQSRENDSIFD